MSRAFIPSVGHVVPTSVDGYRTPHPQAFTWTCPYEGCQFGPADLEGAHAHLHAEHYTAQPVLAGSSDSGPLAAIHQASPHGDAPASLNRKDN